MSYRHFNPTIAAVALLTGVFVLLMELGGIEPVEDSPLPNSLCALCLSIAIVAAVSWWRRRYG